MTGTPGSPNNPILSRIWKDFTKEERLLYFVRQRLSVVDTISNDLIGAIDVGIEILTQFKEPLQYEGFYTSVDEAELANTINEVLIRHYMLKSDVDIYKDRLQTGQWAEDSIPPIGHAVSFMRRLQTLDFHLKEALTKEGKFFSNMPLTPLKLEKEIVLFKYKEHKVNILCFTGFNGRSYVVAEHLEEYIKVGRQLASHANLGVDPYGVSRELFPEFRSNETAMDFLLRIGEFKGIRIPFFKGKTQLECECLLIKRANLVTNFGNCSFTNKLFKQVVSSNDPPDDLDGGTPDNIGLYSLKGIG